MTTIEVGKCYRDDVSDKVEAIAIRGEKVIVAWQNSCGEWCAGTVLVDSAQKKWTPWIDEPAIPWDSVPDWCQWWAVDADEEQAFFEIEPFLEGNEWLREKGGMIVPPKSHRIPYTGDWSESLRQRPGKEVAK
jgi:hypothetical protein